MKKLLLAIASLVVLSSVASAQTLTLRPYRSKPVQTGFQAQSVDVKVSSESLSVLWLQDGLSNNFTAVSYPVFQVGGLGNRVSIVGLGAFNSEFDKTNVWTGTGLAVNVFENSGFSVKAYAGWKGFNLGDNFKSAQGKEAWVLGVGFSLPIK